MKRKLVFLFALLVQVLIFSGVYSFDSIAYNQVHQGITEEALSFLNNDILDEIVDGNDFSFDFNARNSSEVHFDSCNFNGAAQYIRGKYTSILSHFSVTGSRVLEEFGNLLHPAQDFYAHSNWVDMGRTDELFETGLDQWPLLQPFTMHKGVMIIQNSPAISKYTLRLEGKSAIVENKETSISYPGLISGVVDTYAGCPPEVIMMRIPVILIQRLRCSMDILTVEKRVMDQD